MLTQVQAAFREPARPREVADERLIIHQRTDPSKATHLVIFVHGLGGVRYGKKATWGDFPRLVFEDFPGVDVGMYAYRTLLRRWKFWRSIDLEDEAMTFSDSFKGLTNYRSLLLLGHSMGGILCKGAVARLATEPDSADVMQKIGGILLMATPQLGSTKVPKLLSGLTRDSRVLKAHSRYVTTIETTFRDRIHTGLSYPLDDKDHVPCWALIASDDFWVDRLSAGIGLESHQKRTVAGTHTSIVKPKDKKDDGYRFINDCIARVMSNSERPRRKFDARPARGEELRVINELATKLFGQGVSNLQLMHDWWKVNPNVFWVLHRITSAPGYRNQELVGYFCVLPVNDATRDQLREERITGATIPAAGIVPPAGHKGTVYIGAIAGTDRSSKASILLSLSTYLESLAALNGLLLLARPVTDDGLRIAQQYEMEPVQQPGLGHMYEATLG